MRALVEEKGLMQISDPEAIGAIVDAVLEANQYGREIAKSIL